MMIEPGPLVVKDFGVMYVGGVAEKDGNGQTHMSKQAYVRYLIPEKLTSQTPIVLLPGFGLNASIYITTPDGRPGWAHQFLRAGYAVYIMDEPYSGPSGFDTTRIMSVKKGEAPISSLPPIITWGMEETWTRWGFGPKVGTLFDSSQFPMEAYENFYKMVVSVCIDERFKGFGSPLKAEGIINLLEKIGPAIVINHSGSGLSCFDAVKIRPELFTMIVTVEPVEIPTAEDEINQYFIDQKILGVFGDYRQQRSDAGANMVEKFNTLQSLIDRIVEANGTAKMIDLPALGIIGNSHIMMLDKNSDEIAQLIIHWLQGNQYTLQEVHSEREHKSV